MGFGGGRASAAPKGELTRLHAGGPRNRVASLRHQSMTQLLLLRQFMAKPLGRLVHGLVIDAVCWLVM